MCHKLDPKFFNELAQMNPQDVVRRSLAEYDAKKKLYRIEALNEIWEVVPEEQLICREGKKGEPVSVELGLAILFYLMRSKDIPISGKWVSEKELRGGVTFFRGPHAFPTPEIARSCGKDLNFLHEAVKKMGGEPLDMADISYRIKALPRIPMAILFWKGDEEFPPECKLLMDSTIEEHLPLDVIFGLAIEVARRLTGLPLWH